MVSYDSGDVTTTSTATSVSLPGTSWSNLATGLDQNVYVVYNSNILYRVNTDDIITTISDGAIAHISGDTRGMIWLVDTGNNEIHFVDILSTSLSNNISYDIIEYDKISHTTLPSTFDNFRASGDNLGFNWLQKYGYIPEQTVTLTGTSDIFNIWPACGKYSISKYNENHNHGKTLKSYAMQPWLHDNYNLWENFMYTAVGTDKSEPTSIGKLFYERIANFPSNNCDMDDCNIDSIHSYATTYKTDIQKYNFDYPPSIKRLMDICSIKHKRLYGEFDNLTDTFDMYTDYENTDIRENLGEQIDFDTYTLTPGTTIVAYEKFSKVFEKITVSYPTTGTVDADDNIIDAGLDTGLVTTKTDTYPLSAYSPFWQWNLLAPMTHDGNYINREILYYYDFWTFNEAPSAAHVEGIVNFDDDQTTLTPEESGYSSWVDDTEVVDNILEHQLRVGLNMFSTDSRSDCY